MKKILRKIEIIKNLVVIKYGINMLFIMSLMMIIYSENLGSGFKSFLYFLFILSIITNLFLVILLIVKSKSISILSIKIEDEVRTFKTSVLLWSILSIFLILIADLVILVISQRISLFLRKKARKQSYKKTIKDAWLNKEIIKQKNETSNNKNEYEYVKD